MSLQSRRHFLKTLGALSAVGAGGLGINLATMGTLAAQTLPNDYKALVCLFMFGGNDQTNMLVPFDAPNYNIYNSLRPAIAIPQNQLIQINPTNTGLNQFALHPGLAPMAALFDQGKAAFLTNVGTLVQPINKLQYFAKSVPVPAKLFSHNDQQSTWQSLGPEGVSAGWAGKMGDILVSGNSNPIFTCVSASGSQVILSGNNVRSYPVGSDGSAALNITNYNYFGVGNTLQSLMMEDSSNFFESDHAAIIKRSVNANSVLSGLLATAPALALPADLTTVSLAKQLRIVARLISIQASLGIKRQVFFVGIGGFDTHSNQVNQQATLLDIIGRSVNYFYNSTQSLGLANNVTTFSASDFGRTGISNGNGSDHGWGSHHFIVGGAVNGKKLYGNFPVLANNGPDDIGSGRLVPTTSVDQYAATLGAWLGVNNTDLNTIFPNLVNFNSSNLGFI